VLSRRLILRFPRSARFLDRFDSRQLHNKMAGQSGNIHPLSRYVEIPVKMRRSVPAYGEHPNPFAQGRDGRVAASDRGSIPLE
jgi:hypothetical protein